MIIYMLVFALASLCAIAIDDLKINSKYLGVIDTLKNKLKVNK